MIMQENILRAVAPRELSKARAMAHQAVQLLTRAARANLAAAPDDSHSNLGWDASRSAFLSQPMVHGASRTQVGLLLNPLAIFLDEDGQIATKRELSGSTVEDASTWLDSKLDALGLKKTASIELPYELPPEVTAIAKFDTTDQQQALLTLSGWFALAHESLTGFASRHIDVTPGPSAVRCWPHHFDIATYVSLETDDAEAARGIGIGLSPGDASYDQPYLYINPWPHLNAVDLPILPSPGHWHTQGFVGAIATGEAILESSNVSNLATYMDNIFDICRKQLFAEDH